MYGVSGGAATASMEATTDPRIKALILVAGMYDVGEAYPTGDPGLCVHCTRGRTDTGSLRTARSVTVRRQNPGGDIDFAWV